MPTPDPLLSALTQALAAVADPATGRDFVSTKRLRNLAVANGRVSLDLELGYPAKSALPALCDALAAAARTVPGVTELDARIDTAVKAHSAQRGVPLLPGVKNIIGVASGKGGVGKSTTAANLALALAAEGARVGLLDADIYGPSQPTMMGIESAKPEVVGDLMQPLAAHGLAVMSIGFLVTPSQAMAWRGPMATQALDQLLRQTAWGELDYLVIDMPPGTGDIQLTLGQRVPMTGAVVVTTPQDIALIDARKAISLFEKLGVPILGVVENMAVHICSHCGHAEHIFGEGGGQRIAAQYGTDYLGALPLAMRIREQADGGTPTVAAEPEGDVASIYKDIARKVAGKIALAGKDYSSKFPTITVSQNT